MMNADMSSSFRGNLLVRAGRMSLQKAEDNYYLTAKLLLEFAKIAHNLFVGSKLEGRRWLIQLVLQNLKVVGGTVW